MSVKRARNLAMLLVAKQCWFSRRRVIVSRVNFPIICATLLHEIEALSTQCNEEKLLGGSALWYILAIQCCATSCAILLLLLPYLKNLKFKLRCSSKSASLNGGWTFFGRQACIFETCLTLNTVAYIVFWWNVVASRLRDYATSPHVSMGKND